MKLLATLRRREGARHQVLTRPPMICRRAKEGAIACTRVTLSSVTGCVGSWWHSFDLRRRQSLWPVCLLRHHGFAIDCRGTSILTRENDNVGAHAERPLAIGHTGPQTPCSCKLWVEKGISTSHRRHEAMFSHGVNTIRVKRARAWARGMWRGVSRVTPRSWVMRA